MSPGEVIVVYEGSAASMEQTDAELTDRGYEVMSACGSKPSDTSICIEADKHHRRG